MTYPKHTSADPDDLWNGEREIGAQLTDFPQDHIHRYLFARSLLPPMAKVLDVGCGVGYGSHLLAEQARYVVSIDYRPQVVEYARAHWVAHNQKFICGDALQPEAYPQEQFDLITAFEVIEHLRDDRLFLQLLLEHLKPTGILCVSAPNLEVMPIPEDNPWHFRHYLPEQFYKLAKAFFPQVAEFTQIRNPVIPGRGGRTNVIVGYWIWPRMFKLGFVSQEFPAPASQSERYPLSGGIGTYTETVAKGLARSGHEVHVISRARDGDILHTEVADRVLVHRLPDHQLTNWRGIWRLGQAGRVLARALSVGKFLRVPELSKFDLIEAPEWRAETLLCARPSAGAVWVTRLHTPSFVTREFSGIQPDWRTRLIDWAEKLNAQMADAVLSPSTALANLIHDEWRLGPVITLPNPIPVRDNAAKSLPSTIVAGYFAGRFDTLKGFPLLTAALHNLLSDDGWTGRFVLVGSDQCDSVGTEALSILEPWAGEGKLVQFVPRQPADKLRELTESAQITILTSAYENFPYVVLEAMAARRLVIAPRVGGLPEMIEDGITGLLFEPGSREGLEACLRRAFGEPALRAALGHAAEAVARERFSVERLMPVFEVYYAHLIGQRRAGALRKRPFGWWLPNRGPLHNLVPRWLRQYAL